MNFGGLVSSFIWCFLSASYSEVKIYHILGRLARFWTELISSSSSSSSVVPHSSFYGHWSWKSPCLVNKQFQQAVQSLFWRKRNWTASVRIKSFKAVPFGWNLVSVPTQMGQKGSCSYGHVMCHGTKYCIIKISEGASTLSSAFIISRCLSGCVQYLFQEDSILLILIL